MTENAKGRIPFISDTVDDFKALTTKEWIGVLVGLVAAILIQMFLGYQCLGFFVVAVVLYMVPHMLGVSSVRIKAVVGAIFLVLMLVIGSFMVASLVPNNGADSVSGGDRISDVTYDEETGELEFSVCPGTDDWDVVVQTGHVNGLVAVGFESLVMTSVDGVVNHRTADDTTDDSSAIRDLVMTADPDRAGWYNCSVTLDLADGSLYVVQINIDENPMSYLLFMDDRGSDLAKVGLMGNLYTVAWSLVIYVIILVFSALMRNSAEKTRKKMEAEGRLYPKGYGTCKECGAIVLPGEVNCRKCGAYIDVPDEMRPKKKDFFQCSECGAEVPSDASECPRCGAKFDGTENEVVHEDGSVDVSDQDVVCPDCGSTVPANADWCPKCGKMLKKD